MKSEKYSKIYSLIVSNLSTVLQSKKAEDLINGIDEFLVEKNDLTLLKEMYSVRTTEKDSVSFLTLLALNAKLAKFALETNAAVAFEVLRRQREWHLLYHCFTEVMPDERQYKQCFPVERMIFDADYCGRVRQSAKMICGDRFDKLCGEIAKSFDYAKSRLLQLFNEEDDDSDEETDLLRQEKRAVNLMYLSGILDDAIESVLAQKYYSAKDEQRGTFLLQSTEILLGNSPTTLLYAEIANDLKNRKETSKGGKA